MYLCVLNSFSAPKTKRESVDEAQKAFTFYPFEEDDLGRSKEDLGEMRIFFYRVHDSISNAASEMVNDWQ